MHGFPDYPGQITLNPHPKLPSLTKPQLGKLMQTTTEQQPAQAAENNPGTCKDDTDIDPDDSLIEKVRDVQGVSDGKDHLRKKIKITVREEKMADVQFVFPGYNMASRGHKTRKQTKTQILLFTL